jgi:polar amino acid transport system substrate-binding protein
MRSKRPAIVLLLALCAVTAARGEPSLYIAAEPAPTARLHAGRVVGLGPDQMREIMGRAGIAYTIELLPWKRAYAAASERSNACVLYTTRTPERESQFKWVGPLDEAQWVLMARADSPIRLSTLEDARPYTIGTYSGDARDQYLRERGFKVEPAPAELLNPPKLIHHRIDLWAASVRRGSKLLAQHGWSKQIVPLLTFRRIPVYLACNPALPDAMVARMNTALDGMRRDGTMRSIESAHEADNPASDEPADH